MNDCIFEGKFPNRNMSIPLLRVLYYRLFEIFQLAEGKWMKDDTASRLKGKKGLVRRLGYSRTRTSLHQSSYAQLLVFSLTGWGRLKVNKD